MKNYPHFYEQVKHYTHIAEDYCTAYLNAFNRDNGSFSSVEFDEDSMEIKWEDSWNYGGCEEGHINLPISRIDDWKDYLQELVDANNLAKQKAEKERLDEIERREKKLLETLKEKYTS